MRNIFRCCVASTLALLGASSSSAADGSALSVECYPTGPTALSLQIVLAQGGAASNGESQDLVVSEVFVEAHSESGGFWIQVIQPVLPQMTFDLCEIFRTAMIDPEEIDAVRFLAKGKLIGVGDPVVVKGRCDSFPPPNCTLPE